MSKQSLQQGPEPELPFSPPHSQVLASSATHVQPTRQGKHAIFMDERNELAQVEADFELWHIHQVSINIQIPYKDMM